MKSHSFETSAILILTACCLFISLNSHTHAAPVKDKDTLSPGDWNIPGRWDPNGIPVSGTDSVNIVHGLSVGANTSFGSTAAMNESIWNSNQITIAANFTLEHVNNSTLNVMGANPFVAGAGSFKNSGTLVNTSPRFLLLDAASTLDNSGLFIFSGTNSAVNIFNLASPKFINNGSINVNMTNATNLARIFNEQGTHGNGQFVQEGSAIAWTKGILAFAPQNIGGTGIGTSITDANFGNLFDTTSLNNGSSQLRLGGWVDITLNSDVTDLSNVFLGEATAPLFARPGGTTINVTGDDGIRTSASGGGQFDTRGVNDTITNKGKIVVANNGGQVWINGNGTFINEGEMVVEVNRFLLGVTGETTLENKGIVRFTQNGSRLDLWTGTDIFKNSIGGKIVVDLPTPTSTARLGTESGSLNSGYTGQYRHNSGSPMEFVTGTFIFAPPGGINETLTDSLFASMFGPINDDSTLVLSGGISNFQLSTSDVSRVRLGDNTQHLTVPIGGTTLNVTAAGGLRTANGAPQANVAAGRTLLNSGTLVMSSGQQLYINGDGTFQNDGSIIVEDNRFLIGVSGNSVFNNAGTIRFTHNTSRIDLFGTSAANSFNNQAGGLVQVQLPTGASTSDIGRESGSNGTFTNQGTIEILRGELVLESGISNTTAITGGNTLATGTWRILADGARSKLNMQLGGTNIGDVNQTNFDGSITTIGANASLVLSNQNSGTLEFPQLGRISTLDGSLYVHGSVNLPVGASPMNVSGTLGGDGTYTAVDEIVFTGGTLDPSALDGGAGTLTINGDLILDDTTQLSFSILNPNSIGDGVNDLVTVNGALTLDGVLDITELEGLKYGTYRLFNYTGDFDDNGVFISDPVRYALDLSVFGQVNLTVLPIPEPSTGMLLLCGLVALRRRGKRRVS